MEASYWLVAQAWWHKPPMIIQMYHFCLVPGMQKLTRSELAPKAVNWFTECSCLIQNAVFTLKLPEFACQVQVLLCENRIEQSH